MRCSNDRASQSLALSIYFIYGFFESSIATGTVVVEVLTELLNLIPKMDPFLLPCLGLSSVAVFEFSDASFPPCSRSFFCTSCSYLLVKLWGLTPVTISLGSCFVWLCWISFNLKLSV